MKTDKIEMILEKQVTVGAAVYAYVYYSDWREIATIQWTPGLRMLDNPLWSVGWHHRMSFGWAVPR